MGFRLGFLTTLHSGQWDLQHLLIEIEQMPTIITARLKAAAPFQ